MEDEPIKMKEISCKEMLEILMTDEGLTDSVLEGDDGVTLKVNRFALAARSAVFRRMLFGDFVEAKSPVVKIGFHSSVLRAVVEYIHTDSCKIMDATKESWTAVEIQTLVSITAAGMYFHLPGLGNKAHEFLSELLALHPSLSFAVLEGCKQAGPSVPPELEAVALGKIRSIVETDIPRNEISMLSPSLMEEILKDPEMEVYEYELFKMLQVWAESSNDGSFQCGGNPPENAGHRHDIAAQMTQFIRLEHIDPLSLSTVVAASGLVTSAQLLGAFKLQALAAQENHNVAFNRHRKLPAWEAFNDSFRKCLKCLPIRSGTHRWTMEVQELGRYLWLGVVELGTGVLYAFNSWDGVRLYHNESYGNAHMDLRSLKLATGSRVTFVLNMTPSDSCNGTLYASVDDGPVLRLFSDLLDRLDNKEVAGLVPAMCLKCPAKVHLLSMEKI